MSRQIYLAGPLFTAAEKEWMAKLRDELRQHVHGSGGSVIWPGDLFTAEQVNAWGDQAKLHIFRGCLEHLEASDLVVAVLDGTQVDDGTAWEIGYAHAKGKPVIGLRTDFRNGGDTPSSRVNAMIEGSCERICASVDELIAWFAQKR